MMSMKTKLKELELSENLIDEILNIFELYELSKAQYSKPKGIISFRDNINEIESLSKKLHKRLGKLSAFEKQLLNKYVYPDVFELKTNLIRLGFACKEAKNKKFQFSKKEPFLLTLTRELRDLLESYGIPVKTYRDNLFCRILDILLDEPEGSERSFNLLRQILK